MTKIKCKLLCYTNSGHIKQIYTGFHLLSKAGVIELKQEILNGSPIKIQKGDPLAPGFNDPLLVQVNDSMNLSYDVRDFAPIDAEILDSVDFYFKRSFPLESDYNTQKVFPLGLNYEVWPNSSDALALERSLRIRRAFLAMLADALSSVKLDWVLRPRLFTPRVDNMVGYPDLSCKPKVLFMARVWDPKECDEKLAEDFLDINEARVNTLKLLCDEFGADFSGGVSRTDYARAKYSRYVLPSKASGSQGTYIRKLKEYPICVATRGLHNSNGWKLGEYVAFSKAILSEKLHYAVPGDFESGKNYLEFSTAEECVTRARQLFNDVELRNAIMLNNFRYYNSYLRPDALVLNTLAIALTRS